jgi:hypothetical protein
MGIEIYFPSTDTMILDGKTFEGNAIARGTDYLINQVGFTHDEAKAYINELVVKMGVL